MKQPVYVAVAVLCLLTLGGNHHHSTTILLLSTLTSSTLSSDFNNNNCTRNHSNTNNNSSNSNTNSNISHQPSFVSVPVVTNDNNTQPTTTTTIAPLLSTTNTTQNSSVVTTSTSTTIDYDTPFAQSHTVFSRECPSLQQYSKRRTNNEHYPAIVYTTPDHHNSVVICRTPKVGSLEIRGVIQAFQTNSPYALPPNKPYRGLVTYQLDPAHFQDLLFDNVDNNKTARIMFVRHPVRRILSGYLEMAKGGRPWGSSKKNNPPPSNPQSPEAFHRWVREGIVFESYHSSCHHRHSLQRSLDSIQQHWAPPQHCRCGIHDCRVPWQVYKVEEHSIRSVLQPYFDSRHLPPASSSSSSSSQHSKSYNVSAYLPPDVLQRLNEATKEEQLFFGYEPLQLD